MSAEEAVKPAEELLVDDLRWAEIGDETVTGFFVRAMRRGKWGSYDLAVLTRESVLVWLTSKDTEFGSLYVPYNVVAGILGHKMFTKEELDTRL